MLLLKRSLIGVIIHNELCCGQELCLALQFSASVCAGLACFLSEVQLRRLIVLKRERISNNVIRRLPMYLRKLDELIAQEVTGYPPTNWGDKWV